MTGTLRGRVLHAATGEGIADAAITLAGPGSLPDISPLTDENGSFVMDGLVPGTWRLAAIAPDGETGAAIVTVTAGRIATVVIRVASDADGDTQRRRW